MWGMWFLESSVGWRCLVPDGCARQGVMMVGLRRSANLCCGVVAGAFKLAWSSLAFPLQLGPTIAEPGLAWW